MKGLRDAATAAVGVVLSVVFMAGIAGTTVAEYMAQAS
jgi:hypothetical protein